MRSTASAAVFIAALGLAADAHAQSEDGSGVDDALHFTISAGLAAGGYALGAVLFDDVPPRIGLGFGLAAAAGIAKELFDLARKGAGDEIPWRAVRLHARVVPFWVGRDVDGLETICRAAGVPAPDCLVQLSHAPEIVNRRRQALL